MFDQPAPQLLNIHTLGQKVIVENIHQYTAQSPSFGAQPGNTTQHHRMTVCEPVDLTVQSHTETQIHRCNALHPPLKEITQQIPESG